MCGWVQPLAFSPNANPPQSVQPKSGLLSFALAGIDPSNLIVVAGAMPEKIG